MKSGKYQIDEHRTRELNQPELLVLSGKGDKDRFCCVLIPSKARPSCPRCGSPAVRNQGNVYRDFLDAIHRDDDVAFITISLEFRKAKCLSANCGCVYYPQYSFASPYARTTCRLEDAIVRLILKGGCSYAETATELGGKLSRQVVGQVFHRRLKELNEDASEKTKWYRELLE